MKIRVMFIGQHYIDFEDVKSFQLNLDGYLHLEKTDGSSVFVNSDSFTYFSVMSDDEDPS